MVSKLPIPSIDDINLLNTIISERNEPNKTYFYNNKNKLHSLLIDYIKENGNPEKINISNIFSNDKEKFHNLYLNPKNTVKDKIIDVLKDHDLNYCPFCGNLGNPFTLDHYLPKENFPEYSIFSKNLVPMCGECQLHKSTKTIDKNNKRIFIHPYYDNFAEKELLILKINFPYDQGTTFNLHVSNDLETAEKDICSRHFEELKIEKRYLRFFKGEYIRLKKLILKKNNNNFSLKLIDSFLLDILDRAELNSINQWEAIFYRSVLKNIELKKYLLTTRSVAPKTT